MHMLCFTSIEDDDFAFINPLSEFKHLNIYTIHVHGVQSASLFFKGVRVANSFYRVSIKQ